MVRVLNKIVEVHVTAKVDLEEQREDFKRNTDIRKIAIQPSLLLNTKMLDTFCRRDFLLTERTRYLLFLDRNYTRLLDLGSRISVCFWLSASLYFWLGFVFQCIAHMLQSLP